MGESVTEPKDLPWLRDIPVEELRRQSDRINEACKWITEPLDVDALQESASKKIDTKAEGFGLIPVSDIHGLPPLTPEAVARQTEMLRALATHTPLDLNMSDLKGKPILCIDFDGVCRPYKKGWQNGEIYDTIMPGFFTWAKEAMKHFDLVIYSSRSKTEEGIKKMLSWFGIQAGIHDAGTGRFDAYEVKEHLTFADEKPPAFLTIDDRAICFQGNWADPSLTPEALLAFKPWMQNVASESSTKTWNAVLSDCSLPEETAKQELSETQWYTDWYPNGEIALDGRFTVSDLLKIITMNPDIEKKLLAIKDQVSQPDQEVKPAVGETWLVRFASAPAPLQIWRIDNMSTTTVRLTQKLGDNSDVGSMLIGTEESSTVALNDVTFVKRIEEAGQ